MDVWSKESSGWSEHSYVEYSTTYPGFSTLHRKSAFLRRINISCFHPICVPEEILPKDTAKMKAGQCFLRLNVELRVQIRLQSYPEILESVPAVLAKLS